MEAIRRYGREAGVDTQVLAPDWFRSSMLAHLDRFDEAMRVADHGLADAQRDQRGSPRAAGNALRRLAAVR